MRHRSMQFAVHQTQAVDHIDGTADRDDAGHPAEFAAAVSRQMARGFWLLRFESMLEAAFRDYFRRTGQLSRLTVLVIGVVSTLTTLALETAMFGLPAGAALVTRWMQIGVQLPMLVLAALCVFFRPRHRVSDWVTLLSLLTLLASLAVQRLVDVRHGYYLPPELAAAAILAGFTLGRIRFWQVLSSAGLGMVLLLGIELVAVPPAVNTAYHLFTCAMIVTVGLCAGYVLEYFVRWTWLNATLLRYMARFDSLTGLLNRPALENAIERARLHPGADGPGYTLALVDIDGFGDYNNSYGHQAGDTALCRVAETLDAATPASDDVCGRYGGEEFMVLWDGIDAATGQARADAMRLAVEALGIECRGITGHAVITVSIGLCWVSADGAAPSIDEIFATADRRLYEAKSGGRNTVRSAMLGVDDDLSESAS